MLKEIRTEIIINASPEKTWEVLTNFNNFSQWNPFIRQIIGEPKVGTKLQINLLTSSGKTRSYNPTITKVEPLHELRWIGKFIIPGIFDGERIFIIEPIKSNQVRFVHIEIFKGLGVSLSGSRLDEDVSKSFEKMNNAFKEKVELVEG
ncbi:MAG TPA: SRPBCC domain-containing protein [Candidatus Nitrosocosmicus sp.]